MLIRITALDSPPEDALAAVEPQPGLHSAYVLRPMDNRRPLLVTAWESAERADQASITAGGTDYATASFHVAGDPARSPKYAQIVYFDRPRTRPEAEAVDLANRERIWPAVRDIPGNLGALVGANADGTSVVIALTTSRQAIEDSQQAIMSTALLPGEDPALLTGPDRMHIAHVLSAVPAHPLSV